MNKIGFPVKDLRRRKVQTSVTVLGLSLCLAVTVSTVLFAQNAGLRITGILTGRLNVGYINIFSRFATLIIYLSFFVAGVMTYFFVSTNMLAKARDIGIIKATGCLPDQAFGYFATQLFLIVLSSCALGTGMGVFLTYLLSYFNGGSVFSSQLSINIWTILAVLIVFVLVAHLFGIQPINKAMQAKPADALFPYYLRGVSFKSAQSPLIRLGVSFRIAYRAFMRRKTVTLSTIFFLSLALASTTIATAGTAIANQTTQTYLTQGIGENIVLIGHEDITTRYLYSLSQLFQSGEKATINLSDSKYAIPQTTVSALKEIPGAKVDPRLFLEIPVYERPTILIVDMQYFTIGDHRSSEAVVFGVDPEQIINNWSLEGRTLSKTDTYSAVVGDSLASKILSFPLEQKVRILENAYDVVGVALDPFNLGFVVYLPFSALSQASGLSNYNLLLMKIDPLVFSPTLDKIQDALEGTELKAVELNPILRSYSQFFQAVWSSFTLVSLFFLAVMAICLLTYMTLRIKEQEPEIAIMRALGGKPRRVVSIVMIQAALTVFLSSIIGISAGLFVSLTFLISTPTISMSSFITVGAWLLFAVSLLYVSCLYPALRVSKKPLASIVPKL